MATASATSALRRLSEAAAALNLSAEDTQLSRMVDYLDLLSRWNATYNVTAVRDREAMLTHHLIDCLPVVAALRRYRAEQNFSHILDVGSGGGLPGVVIAVMEPRLRICCVDSVGKKAAFVRQVAAELILENLSSVHGRVEAMVGSFDIVIARAFASLSDFVRMTRERRAAGGIWLAMKGKTPVKEMAALASDIDVFHVEPLIIPGLAAERCLVWMRPRHESHRTPAVEDSDRADRPSSDNCPRA
jgi:16S rRNA (guanine527-N7)-methyltransferase